ncbi:MAG TPA: DoxX family protein [Desulfuromonadales bacterium]|nr:DoxX family protein [Desulfuromonadales bacterium]
MSRSSFARSMAPHLLSLMRFVVAFLFIEHGGQKLFGYPVALPGPPIALFSQFGLAGMIEFCGGLLLFLGLFTRWAAFVLSGEMAAAYFLVHAGKSFWPIANQGELAVLYCFVFLYFAAAGAGPWSLDRLLGKT